MGPSPLTKDTQTHRCLSPRFKITAERLFKLCKGEEVTHVRGEIRDINICSISGSVYMSTVQEATVMSLCTF